VGSLSVTNSTLYNYGGERFFAPGNTTQTDFTLNFSNNTVYKWSKASYNFFDVGAKFSNASVYTIKDNIFNLIYSGTKGAHYILNCTNGGTLNAANNLSVDFFGYNFTGTDAVVNNSDLTLDSGVLAGITSIPFADAANYNFEIQASSALATASSTGGIIGDPQWLKSISTQLGNNEVLNAFARVNENGQILINSSLKNGKATIYSLMGRKLEELTLATSNTLTKKYNSGIYLVQFEEAGSVSTQKVIVK
jgi:hypothetical protein